jgi:uncharacterized membrane protein YhaH (DUF805 family)
MNFFEAISSGFRNYVNFSGRAIRSEYWYWTLFTTVVSLVFGVIDEVLNPGDKMGVFSIVTMLIELAVFLPGLAVSVRRLHDIDRTGWWLLLAFTVIGFFVLIYWACQRGTSGPNRFGPDPMPALGMGRPDKASQQDRPTINAARSRLPRRRTALSDVHAAAAVGA